MARPINPQAQQALALYAQNNARQQAAANRAYSTTRQGYLNVFNKQARSDQGIAQGYLAQEKAIKAAAAKRSLAGQQVLAGYGRMYDNQMAALEGAGQEQRQDLSDRYTNLTGRAGQDLISRGLSNSTVRNTVEAGLERDRAKGIRGIDMGIQEQRGRMGMQLDQMRLGYADQNAQRNFQTQLQLADLANRRYGFLDQSAQRRAQGGYQLAGLAGQYANQQGRYPSLGELMQLSNMGQEQGFHQMGTGGVNTVFSQPRGGGGPLSPQGLSGLNRAMGSLNAQAANRGRAADNPYANAAINQYTNNLLQEAGTYTIPAKSGGGGAPNPEAAAFEQMYGSNYKGGYEHGAENPAFVSKGGGGGGDYYAGLGSQEAYEQAKYFGGLG